MNIIKLTCVTLSQDCNVITSLQWGGENITMLWQGCDKVVTSLYQAGDKHCNEVVATLWMNRQCGCKVAVGLWKYYKVVTRLSQGCDKVVATLWRIRQCGCKVAVGLWKYYKVMTRLSQPCEGLDNVAARLQWDCEYTTRLWQGCRKVVTRL